MSLFGKSIRHLIAGGLALTILLSLFAVSALAEGSADTEEADVASGEASAEVVLTEEEIQAAEILALDNAGDAEGWYTAGSRWVYYTEGVRRMNGWIEEDSVWYYISDGFMVSGCLIEIGGKIYCFDASGAMRTGWVENEPDPVTGESTMSYYGDDGVRVENDWVKDSKKWHYVKDGVMAVDMDVEIDGDHYRFDEEGLMVTGWFGEEIGIGDDGEPITRWSYYTPDGIRRENGWYYLYNTQWYYFRDGVMQTGHFEVDGDWYDIEEDGSYSTGWETSVDGYSYYHDSMGRCCTGWKVIDNETYYFYRPDDPNGGPAFAMAAGVTIDRISIDDSGHADVGTRKRMNLDAQHYPSQTDYLIVVDRTECVAGIYEGHKDRWKQIDFFECSPGAAYTQTYVGIFSIFDQGYYFVSGGGAYCYYYSSFDGNQAMHSILYNPSGSIADGRTGMHLSHGCVRMPIEKAKWIYNNCTLNTTVVVY